MKKSDTPYLGHMLDNAAKAQKKVVTLTKSEFDTNEDVQLILAHLIQTIGEAASKVFDTTKVAHPEIPWKDIVGMRDIVVHNYFSVDIVATWKTISVDIPVFKEAIDKILGDLKDL